MFLKNIIISIFVYLYLETKYTNLAFAFYSKRVYVTLLFERYAGII